MQYIGYNWELTSNTIIPDEEINTHPLGWKAGDYWQLREHEGKKFFVKVDPLVQFLMDGSNEQV
jgi:hypothetical protein